MAERCRMDNRSCRLHCSLFRTAQPREGACRPPWYRQVADEDGSQCSVWTAHEVDEHAAPPTTEVEWVGDLVDLETSTASVPAYIRSLRADGEALEACALRLSR